MVAFFLATSFLGCGGGSGNENTTTQPAPDTSETVFFSAGRYSGELSYELEAFGESATAELCDAALAVVSANGFYEFEILENGPSFIFSHVGIEPIVTFGVLDRMSERISFMEDLVQFSASAQEGSFECSGRRDTVVATNNSEGLDFSGALGLVCSSSGLTFDCSFSEVGTLTSG